MLNVAREMDIVEQNSLNQEWIRSNIKYEEITNENESNKENRFFKSRWFNLYDNEANSLFRSINKSV